MGRLNDDVERLCREIRTLRKARKRFIGDLRESTGALRGAVSEMRTRFSRSHAEQAQAAQLQRSAFLLHLRGGVAAQRRESAADLAGARRVWHGKRA
jgi:hypothetical protein